MRLQSRFIFGIFLVLYVAFCPTTMAAKDFAAEMEEENERWLNVYKSQNALAFGPMYTSDAVILPQGSPPIQGRTAIVQFWFEMLKKQFSNPTLEIIDLREEGKLAYQTCRWSVLEPIENGAVKKITGNTLRIFERQPDGRWLIKVQMSNSDGPAAPNNPSSKSVVTR